MLCCLLFKKKIIKKFFHEYHQSVKQLGPDHAPAFCLTQTGPDQAKHFVWLKQLGPDGARHFVWPVLGRN